MGIVDGLYAYPFKYASQATRQAVWNKGQMVPGYDPRYIRKDICGAFIAYSDHGNTNSDFGWEIDHIYPKALGGSDDLSNLQPLQWENNRRKDNRLDWNCD